MGQEKKNIDFFFFFFDLLEHRALAHSHSDNTDAIANNGKARVLRACHFLTRKKTGLRMTVHKEKTSRIAQRAERAKDK
jgi:hypothetical protein